jgi:hypothetical protein
MHWVRKSQQIRRQSQYERRSHIGPKALHRSSKASWWWRLGRRPCLRDDDCVLPADSTRRNRGGARNCVGLPGALSALSGRGGASLDRVRPHSRPPPSQAVPSLGGLSAAVATTTAGPLAYRDRGRGPTNDALLGDATVMKGRKCGFCLALVGVALLLCCNARRATQSVSSTSASSSMLHDLRSLAELKAAFNAGIGKPRIILLLSPT